MTKATTEELIAAYKETGSVWKTAERLGLCGQSVHERLQRMGYPMANTEWTPEETEAAKHLTGEGIPISRIASRLGRSYAAVACKISELGVKHPYRPPLKVKRGLGLTKKRMLKFAKYILRTGTPVTKAAKQHRIGTTSLVNALQRHAPELWSEYLARYSKLKNRLCSGCANTFTPLSAKQKYCSAKCGGHARADAKYFGGNRRNAIGLASGICQLCEEKGKILSAHHIIGKENDPENNLLIALCTGCHHIVGILGRRRAVTDCAFWENLIALCVARAWADKGRKSLVGAHVCVDIEGLTKRDLRDDGLLEPEPHIEVLPLFDEART